MGVFCWSFWFFSVSITIAMPALMASLLLAYIPFISLSNSFKKLEGICTKILFVCGLFIAFTF